MHKLIAAPTIVLFASAASAAENAELARTFQEDQADRSACPEEGPCFIVPPRDAQRQRTAMDQYAKSSEGTHWDLHPVDENAVTDEERSPFARQRSLTSRTTPPAR